MMTDSLSKAILLILGAAIGAFWSISSANAETVTLNGALSTDTCSFSDSSGHEVCSNAGAPLAPVPINLESSFDGGYRGSVRTTTTVSGHTFFATIDLSKFTDSAVTPGFYLHLAVGDNDWPGDAETLDVGPLSSLDALPRLSLHGNKVNNGGTRIQPTLTIGK